jgi:uncharacterized membrane protein
MYSDREMDEQMGVLLRAGVIISCGVMLVGAALYMVRHSLERPDYGSFHGVPLGLDSVRGVLREVRLGSARGIIQLGVLLMVVTPVMRVVFAVAGFARQKQWAFVWISLTVLALLVWGLAQQS